MFGRRKNIQSKKDVSKLLTGFIDHHVETERMKASARASEQPVAILKPQIPIGKGPSAGWFGGNATLPKDMPWPEQDGQKLLFVGQINLTALPRDLWSGLGPRSGWLGIFLPAQGKLEPTVLHFEGPLVEVTPPPPNSAGWTRIHDFDEPKTFALPRWPIIVESRPGNELHGADARSSKNDQSTGDLSDPAYPPFDQKTVALLFACLDEAVTFMARQIIRFPAMKKLRPADAAWFEHQKSIVLDTFVRFFEIEGRMRAARQFSKDEITGYIDELKNLSAYDFEYPRNDDEGYCELVLRETKLLDPQPARSNLRRWWHRYEAGLTNHALKAYTSDPASLPSALRERLEAAWQQETSFGFGAMGHAPSGHIYTPHGPDSPNEVLLELQTSKLTGWIWADCKSLVLLIDRAALRSGDFSAVTFDITN